MGGMLVSNAKYLIVAVVFGGGMLTQVVSSASALTNTIPDPKGGLLAAYHAIQ